MALATKYPYCQMTSRVAHDQLKLRASLVRSSRCSCAALCVTPSGSALPTTTASAVIANKKTPAAPASVMPTSGLSFAIPSHFEREYTARIYHEGNPKPEDPLQCMTLVDIDSNLSDSFDNLDAAAQTMTYTI